MEVLQNEFATGGIGAIKRFKSICKIGRKFIKSPIYKEATFIMLWKLISKIPKKWVKLSKDFIVEALVDDVVNLCVEYAHEYIEKKRDTEEYKKFTESLTRCTKYIRFVKFFQCNIDKRLIFVRFSILSVFEHCRILWYLHYQVFNHNTGWMYVSYNLIAENTKHLDEK